MPILYSLRSHPMGYMCAKFDADFNVAAIYHLHAYTNGQYDCDCPAGVRPTCKHRKMVPIFDAAKAVDTDKFYCYETQTWHQPIPTLGEADPSAALASAASVTSTESHAGEGPGPSPLAVERASSPSEGPSVTDPRRRSEPAPALRRLK